MPDCSSSVRFLVGLRAFLFRSKSLWRLFLARTAALLDAVEMDAHTGSARVGEHVDMVSSSDARSARATRFQEWRLFACGRTACGCAS